jgi:hypothetical protein
MPCETSPLTRVSLSGTQEVLMGRRSLTNRRTILALSGAAAALLPATGSALPTGTHLHAVANAKASAVKAVRTEKTYQTAAALRDLWVGHIFWVRAECLAVINRHNAAARVSEHQAVAGLLLAHAGHHIQQIQQLKDGKYEAEAQTWDEMKKHIYEIADATADALAKQFAKDFA